MGCFDVADGLSGITIKEGDECGLVLLNAVASYPHTSNDGRLTINPCTTAGGGNPSDLYSPYCLPIWGKYNDYGSLEDVVRDNTVIGLEKHFQTSIDKILKMIGSGRSTFDSYSGVFDAYGNGLDVSYHDKPTANWLTEAGFRKTNKDTDQALYDLISTINEEDAHNSKKEQFVINRNDVWILPGTRVAQLWDEDAKKWDDTNIPVAWFVLTKDGCRTYYTRSSGHGAAHNWEWTSDRAQKDFAETVMKYTKYGFFGTGEGHMIGIKKECWELVLEISELSGMFIDKQLFLSLTEKKKVKSNNNYPRPMEDIYPSKHMMPLLGFKFVKMVDGEDLTKEIEDDGMPLLTRDRKPPLLVYTHEVAPDYYFTVDNTDDNMNVDLYDKDMNDLKNCTGMFGERYSVGTFNPYGIQDMLDILSGGGRGKGTKIQIDHLLDLPDNYFFYEKMKDHMRRRDNSLADIKKWNEETAYISDLSDDEKKALHESRTEEERKEFTKMLMRSIRADENHTRDGEHRIGASIGFYSKFSGAYKLYAEDMVNQPESFVDATNRWKRFISVMYGANKIFIPSSHMFQHGEYSYQLSFAEKVMKRVLDKKIENDEYNDNDDDIEEETIPFPVHLTGENINVYMKDGVLHIEQKVLSDGEEK